MDTGDSTPGQVQESWQSGSCVPPRPLVSLGRLRSDTKRKEGLLVLEKWGRLLHTACTISADARG